MLQWSRLTLVHTAVLMNHAKPGNVQNLGKERNLQRPPKPWEYTIWRHSPHLWKNSSFRICRRKNKQEGKKGILLQILRLHCPQGYWWAVWLFLIIILKARGGDFSLINVLHMMQCKFPYCIPLSQWMVVDAELRWDGSTDHDTIRSFGLRNRLEMDLDKLCVQSDTAAGWADDPTVHSQCCSHRHVAVLLHAYQNKHNFAGMLASLIPRPS